MKFCVPLIFFQHINKCTHTQMYTYIPPFKNNRIILFILLCNKLFITNSVLFWPCCTACGILVPQPEIEPTPPALEAGVLTTGLPGKSLLIQFYYLESVCSDYLFIHDSVLEDCVFLEMYPFLLGCPICWHITIHCIRL